MFENLILPDVEFLRESCQVDEDRHYDILADQHEALEEACWQLGAALLERGNKIPIAGCDEPEISIPVKIS